jgi:hypothetical protein
MCRLPVEIERGDDLAHMKSDRKGVLCLGAVFMSKTISMDFGSSPIEWQATENTDILAGADTLATAIVKADFAKDWFADAHNEVTKETSDLIAAAGARRREIIFSVCALESYILEWTREILLARYGEPELLNKLEKYFPAGQKTPITDKWKDVPKELCRDGLIKDPPDLNGQTWQTFKEQVYEYYRNSLIHASVSRPQKKVTASLAPPTDWKDELGRLSADWAIGIVAELIRA